MPALKTRRRALQILATGVGVLATPIVLRSQPVPVLPPVVGPEGAPSPRLRVSVHTPGGDHLDWTTPANVTVNRADDGNVIHLKRTPPRQLTYDGESEPGRHRLRVEVDGYAVSELTVDVPAGGLTVPVYLGQAGWPFFRIGQSIYPFEPKDDFVAVAFDELPPGKARWQFVLREIEKLGLVPYNREGSGTYWSAGRTIATFRSKDAQPVFSDSADSRLDPDLVAQLSRLLSKERARVGLPIGMRPGRVKILDNRYVVKMSSTQSPAIVREMARSYGAMARRIEGLGNAWLFEFGERNNYRKHLRATAALADRNDVSYVEPSLIMEVEKHSCVDTPQESACRSVPSPVTSDPWSRCQESLALQRVPDAWCFLEQRLGASSRRGSSKVCLATVDVGINTNHPDVNPALATQVKLCMTCSSVPEDPHGMGVFGIISAKPNNHKGTSGIAAGVRHHAVMLKRNWVDPPWYAQLLLWLSGVEPSVSFSQFPKLPNRRSADIISLSHGIANITTPQLVADALARLTTEGRKDPVSGAALGTVVVCSAGNWGTDITGTQVVAADPNVIAVGNTMFDEQQEEVLWPSSNHGARLDLCAQGQGAPSLLADPAQTLIEMCVPDSPAAGAVEFGGTSAAGPMVAATAALMLSVNRHLSWNEVRDSLRSSARCVDMTNGLWVDHRSYLYGSGRLDVHGAVRAAADINPS